MARRSLSFTRYALAGTYADKAGREAYLAGFHAASVFIAVRTGRTPKTHSGTRSEFARLPRQEPRLSAEQIGFLGWAFELKSAADYGQHLPVPLADAERAIAEAATMVAVIAEIIGQ